MIALVLVAVGSFVRTCVSVGVRTHNVKYLSSFGVARGRVRTPATGFVCVLVATSKGEVGARVCARK
jgi:uncharacterized membrane protein